MAGRRYRLTAARKAAGYSLESFAFEVGVDRSTAIRWESGRSEPQPRHRPRIAEALDRSLDTVDELLAVEDAPRPVLTEPPSRNPGGAVLADDRMDYVLRNPRSVDFVAVAQIREEIRDIDSRYEATPSALLVGQAGQYLGHVMLLKGYAGARVARELLAAEAEAATLVGQLVWDASQRHEHSAARLYFEQARTAARQIGDTAAEGLALLRESFVALYGEHDPRSGLDLAVQSASIGGQTSSVIAGLALLHTAEAYAMLGTRRPCEEALSAAESRLAHVDACDPASELYSPTQPGRLAGSCYLFLGDARRAQQLLEETASAFEGPSKGQAIVQGNLGLALVRQQEIDEACSVLHSAIDTVEATRGGGGLNIVFDAGRELRRWRDLSVVRDLHDRLLTLMTAA